MHPAAILQVRDPARSYEIRLHQGVTTRGVVIDSESGRPIPNAKVRVFPADFRSCSQ